MRGIDPSVIDEISRLAAAGSTDPQIAQKLGRSRRSVHWIRQRCNIPAASRPGSCKRRPTNTDDIDEVAVYRLMHGDPTIPLYQGNDRTHGYTIDVVEAIRRLAAAGHNDREISIRIGGRISRDAIHTARARYGIPSGMRLAVAW